MVGTHVQATLLGALAAFGLPSEPNSVPMLQPQPQLLQLQPQLLQPQPQLLHSNSSEAKDRPQALPVNEQAYQQLELVPSPSPEPSPTPSPEPAAWPSALGAAGGNGTSSGASSGEGDGSGYPWPLLVLYDIGTHPAPYIAVLVVLLLLVARAIWWVAYGTRPRLASSS